MTISGDFWAVTLGDRMLFLKACERCNEAEADAELAFWRRTLGDGAQLERISVGADMVRAQMACAISTLSRDGTGVKREHLTGLGFSAFQVERYFTEALEMVTATFKDDEAILTTAEMADAIAAAGNVLAFRPRAAKTSPTAH